MNGSFIVHLIAVDLLWYVHRYELDAPYACFMVHLIAVDLPSTSIASIFALRDYAVTRRDGCSFR